MSQKPRQPILPSNFADPTGVDKLERGAIKEFQRRFKLVLQTYKSALERIPSEPVVNRRYTYQLDPFLLSSLLANLDLEVDSILMGIEADRRVWLFDAFAGVAYQRGTAQEFANLAQQSTAYKAGRVDLQSLIRSDPYQRRIALVRTRVFEEMKGLTASVKADMARVLTDGVGRGLNPRDVAENLTKQTGIESRRANRIARSEIPTALRRAKWDEAEQAQQEYGLKFKEMHLSALSPTTRATHAARHSKLYTIEQVRDWWAQDGNSINCKCTTTSVMVDSVGKPLTSIAIERAKAAKKAMEQRNYKWANDEE